MVDTLNADVLALVGKKADNPTHAGAAKNEEEAEVGAVVSAVKEYSTEEATSAAVTAVKRTTEAAELPSL